MIKGINFDQHIEKSVDTPTIVKWIAPHLDLLKDYMSADEDSDGEEFSHAVRDSEEVEEDLADAGKGDDIDPEKEFQISFDDDEDGDDFDLGKEFRGSFQDDDDAADTSLDEMDPITGLSKRIMKKHHRVLLMDSYRGSTRREELD